MGMSLFAVLVLSAVCNLASSLQHQFHFVSTPTTFAQALYYCKEKYTHLATISDAQDMEEMASLAGGAKGYVGLRKFWGWSRSSTDDYREGEEDYKNFPRGPQDHQCGSIEETGYWVSSSCSSNLKFFCYNGSATEIPERFTFVNIAKNWTAAQAHCKNLSTDLAIVRNQQENEELQKLVEGGPAWIGLTREYRHWMDRTVATFIPWDSSMPLLDDQCGYLQTQSKPFKLKSTHCGVQMGFFCYSVQMKARVVKLALTADELSVDVNDPAVMDSLIKAVTEKLKARGLTEEVKVSGVRFAKEEISDKPKEPEQPLTDTEETCIA